MAQTTEYLPFHAINEFMRPDFRLKVIRDTLNSQNKLPGELGNELNQRIKKYIKVPGFRNSDKAPAMIKVLPTSKAFEKHPDLVATILACWAEINSPLRDRVFDLLKTRNWAMFDEIGDLNIENLSVDLIKKWPIFPIKFNRTKLPGFYTHWPKDENFEILYENFTKLNEEINASIDQVSLMAVWISMRLPYHVDSNEVPEGSGSDILQ